MRRTGRIIAIASGLALSATLVACNPRTTTPGRLAEAVSSSGEPTLVTSTTKARKPSRPRSTTTTSTSTTSTTAPTTTMTSTSTTTSTTLAPTSTTTSTTSSTTSTTAAPSPSGLLWRSGYDGLTSAAQVWQYEQEAAADRIQLVDGSHGRVMRVQVKPGDLVSNGNRAEVYARHASPRDTPGELWPDPVGSVRWYGFDLYVPNDFVSDPTGLVWFVFTQWKGRDGGQPAIALEVKRDRLEMAGASARNDLGPIKRGQWERIVVGVHIDPTSAGWVEVYRDGSPALARTHRPTTTYVNGLPDPIYLKQGIYRSPSWTIDHALEFGPTSVGRSKADVD